MTLSDSSSSSNGTLKMNEKKQNITPNVAVKHLNIKKKKITNDTLAAKIKIFFFYIKKHRMNESPLA